MNYLSQQPNYLVQKFVATLASAFAATLKLKFTATLALKFLAPLGLNSIRAAIRFEHFDSIFAWKISQLFASLHFLFPKNLIPCVDRLPIAIFYRPFLTSNTKLF